jgi:hypothetical protein
VLTEALASLEGSALAASLRGSTWLYPLVNAGHIVGIALLFGAIAPLDLRLMGAWSGIPLGLLSRVLVPVAAMGLALAALAGGLLFMTKASEYVTSGFFQAKMLVLAVGVANALTFHVLRRPRARHRPDPEPLPSVALQRLHGATSLTLWLSVIVLGRLIGYF